MIKNNAFSQIFFLKCNKHYNISKFYVFMLKKDVFNIKKNLQDSAFLRQKQIIHKS